MTSVFDSEITVSPEKIRLTAQQARQICERLIGSMESIESTAADTASFWDSDGARLLYDYFKEDKQGYEKIKNGIRLKINQLDEIAAMYAEAENKSGEAASALPDTILS